MPNDLHISQQYQTILSHGGLYPRADRSIIEVTGADRAKWLNNLVTNIITTLTPGEGNYAFAVNVKGRTIFDLNMLVLPDRLWLDIDRRQIPVALTHLNKYTITEDVRLEDAIQRLSRIALLGPGATALVEKLGLGNLTPMAWLQHIAGQIGGMEVRLIRHDFAGIFGAEIVFPTSSAAKITDQITKAAASLNMTNVDRSAVDILRIESGIPASIDDIDEDVVPPETGQIERGISYHKGCYLGQEVIERMRSHGILARKLVGVRFEGDEVVSHNTKLMINDKEVGRTVTGCFSEALQAPLSLAYVKTIHAAPGTKLSTATAPSLRTGEIIPLPVHQSEPRP